MESGIDLNDKVISFEQRIKYKSLSSKLDKQMRPSFSPHQKRIAEDPAFRKSSYMKV